MLMTSDEKRLPHRIGIDGAGVHLEGELELPPDALAVVLFPHGSGISSRDGDERLASHFRAAGLATLLVNLLTGAEQNLDARTACFRFDSSLLAARLVGVLRWLADQPTTRGLRIGCFGTGMAASAVFAAAHQLSSSIGAVILYDAQADPASQTLNGMTAPTLLMVDGTDEPLLNLNRAILEQLGEVDKQLTCVPSSRHLLDEPGAFDEVSNLAIGWFTSKLVRPTRHYSTKPR